MMHISKWIIWHNPLQGYYFNSTSWWFFFDCLSWHTNTHDWTLLRPIFQIKNTIWPLQESSVIIWPWKIPWLFVY